MENLTGGTPPVRYLPCVVPCKLYFNDVKINYELLDLYWELGKNIVSKQKNAK